jgi:hypothetical protein
MPDSVAKSGGLGYWYRGGALADLFSSAIVTQMKRLFLSLKV